MIIIFYGNTILSIKKVPNKYCIIVGWGGVGIEKLYKTSPK